CPETSHIYTFPYTTLFRSRTKSSAGDFVSFVIGIVVMYQPVKSLTRLYNQLHQAAAASERVFELLETRSAISEPASPVPLRARRSEEHTSELQSLAYLVCR